MMRNPDCVGALIRDRHGRVFVHKRTATRRVFPRIWDIVGGHIEKDETAEQALAREIKEETGWKLSRVVAQIADWEWEHDGIVRRELDFLVEVDGDLSAPELEDGKHDAYVWIGVDDLQLMMQGRTDGDTRLRDIVAIALQFDGLPSTDAKPPVMRVRDNTTLQPPSGLADSREPEEFVRRSRRSGRTLSV